MDNCPPAEFTVDLLARIAMDIGISTANVRRVIGNERQGRHRSLEYVQRNVSRELARLSYTYWQTV